MEPYKIPDSAYKPSTGGCSASLTLIGSLIAGIYRGVAQSKGMPLDSTLESALIYGPVAFGGLSGLIVGSEVSGNQEVREQISKNAPTKEAESWVAGCGTLSTGIFGAAVCFAAQFAGYWIGKQF